MSGPVLIVKTGSTMPSLAARRGDYEDWIADGLGLPNVVVCHVEAGDALPDPSTPRAVVVTGSGALVTERLAWSEHTRAWLPHVVERGAPMLAICYGHQLLADALGGTVGMNLGGREMGAVDVELEPEAADDALFSGLPSTLRVSSSHRQSVLALPSGARRLASNAANENQAYAIGARAWGVQFHPEWDHDVIRVYLEARAEILRAEGLDPDALLARVAPSTDGAAILSRFAEIVG